jgi:hypothetical protein
MGMNLTFLSPLCLFLAVTGQGNLAKRIPFFQALTSSKVGYKCKQALVWNSLPSPLGTLRI